ncbi:MAG: tail fiber protein, partial [Bacteroidota bacterium]
MSTLGEIRMFGGNFAPRGWALCEGQVRQISNNDALYGLINTTYGGDGVTTYKLPDFRGRTPIGVGMAPGLKSSRALGDAGGNHQNVLKTSQVAAHTHPVAIGCNKTTADNADPQDRFPGLAADNNGTLEIKPYGSIPGVQTYMEGDMLKVNNSGGKQPVPNLQPCLG